MIQNHVTSLETAKRMKELGFNQESDFWWQYGGKFSTGFQSTLISKEEKEAPRFGSADSAYSYYSAYHVGELGERLPINIYDEEDDCEFFLLSGPHQEVKLWFVAYAFTSKENSVIYIYYEDAENEAEARAKMLIYLAEQELIDPKSL